MMVALAIGRDCGDTAEMPNLDPQLHALAVCLDLEGRNATLDGPYQYQVIT